jgi:Tat protein translocase TatB subunit
MFDIGAAELLVIIIVAVIVIGPKDLPLAMRVAGRWIGKVRRISAQFRSGIDTMVREAELEDMEKKWKAQNEEIMRRSAALTEAEAGTPLMTGPPPVAAPPAVRLQLTSRPWMLLPMARPALILQIRAALMFKVEDLDETRAPLLDHLIELRTRIIRALLALAVGFGVCLYFADEILGFLVLPLKQAFPKGEGQLIFTKLPEVFFVELKVALFAGFMVSFPVIANQLWAFVAPGLYAREKKAFLPFLIATPVLFLGGAALAYFVVMPTAFRFFLGFGGETGGWPFRPCRARGIIWAS